MKKKGNHKVLRQKRELFDRWEDVETTLAKSRDEAGDASHREPFLEQINKLVKEKGCDYLAVIQGLDKSWSVDGTKWLQGIVDGINQQVIEPIPSFSDDTDNI